MAASLWLPRPPIRSSLFLLPNNPSSSASPPLCNNQAGRGNLLLCCSSGVSSSSVVTKEQEEFVQKNKEQEEAATAPSEEVSEPTLLTYKDDPNFRGCKGCGRDEVERGCNGEGRIQGGIAAVPGFGWWPIKAYRPCPGFVASGGRYRRQGQSMDDVASGRGKKVSSGKKRSEK